MNGVDVTMDGEGVAEDASASTPPPPPSGFRPISTSHAKIGELYALFIVNTLLTILTLGIYRFWAKTRTRQYMWHQVEIDGDRAEYTGTGGELFKGFLLVTLVVFLPLLVLDWLFDFFVLAEHPEYQYVQSLYQTIFALILVPAAIFRARRYRLSRSQWRGIRAGQSGETKTYIKKSIFHWLLTAITLGIYTPYKNIRLAEYLINNTWFGGFCCEFSGQPKQLMKSFLIAVACFLPIAVIFGSGMIWFVIFLKQLISSEDNFVLTMVALFLLLGPIIAVLVNLPFVWYKTKELKHVVENTRLGPWRFQLSAGARDVLKLLLGNGFILLFTLGLGLPFVFARFARFLSTHLLVAGPENFEGILQSEQATPGSGEGLAFGLDVDAF